MTEFTSIVTHPGGAHKDEVLACSVLIALRAVPIFRREPTPADLANPATCVVDVGNVHDPVANNFDHHQFPKEGTPTCSLSLVLQNFGLYAEAREFCEWLETAEWFDCRGPFATAAWLGVEREILNQLNSPVDITLLKRFALAAELKPGDPLWEMMRMVGEDLIDYLNTLRDRLAYLEKNTEFWDITTAAGTLQVLFLPRVEPLLEDPSMGMDRFIERRGKIGQVAGLIYPDRRNTGYGLSRFRDDQRLDFTRVAQNADVHFAHARGFVAKTSATETGRLRALLGEAAGVKSGS